MIRSTSLKIPYQTAFSNGTISAVADVPLEKGGGGQGFGPHELLEAGFATCLTMTVQMSAAKHGIPLQGVHCEVRLDRTVPEVVTFRYDLTFDGPLTAEQSAKLRDAATRCPVGKTLSGAIHLRPTTEEELK
jgi:putative redox protein